MKLSFWAKMRSLFGGQARSKVEAGLDPPFLALEITKHAREVAEKIRLGNERDYRNPIFLHSIMPRAGSVFVGNIISLHPDISAYPNEIWESPFLESMDHINGFSDHFFSSYANNRDSIGRDDFFVIFAASYQRYLYDATPKDKVLFVKEPRTRFLPYFYEAFPDANLTLLVRDGRDLVNSTVESWPHFGFEEVCHRWAKCARICLDFMKKYENSDRFILVKFEEVSEKPESFVESMCKKFKVDFDKYPIDKLETIPIQGSSALQVAGNVSWDPVKKPPSFNPIGRWNNWTDYRKKTFDSIAGEELRRLGYQ